MGKSVNQLFLWLFSIAMLVYRRVVIKNIYPSLTSFLEKLQASRNWPDAGKSPKMSMGQQVLLAESALFFWVSESTSKWGNQHQHHQHPPVNDSARAGDLDLLAEFPCRGHLGSSSKYLSGWWLSSTSLKHMSSSVGMMTFPIYGKIQNVPNHQPYIYIYIIGKIDPFYPYLDGEKYKSYQLSWWNLIDTNPSPAWSMYAPAIHWCWQLIHWNSVVVVFIFILHKQRNMCIYILYI